jgi:uncharacterized membrane protein
MVLVVKVGMSVFYGIVAATGGAWLYFFNRRNVKAQFGSPADVVVSTTLPPTQPSKRPLSISIIGWILLVTSFLALPTLLLRFPMFFMGFLVTGWRATLFMFTWCFVQGAAGMGLLRLRSWGRTLSICLFSFGLLNVSAIALLPGTAARFEQVNGDVQAKMQARMGVPAADMPTPFSPEMVHSFTWIGAIVGGAFTALQLWFVVTRKQAFLAATEVPALSP